MGLAAAVADPTGVALTRAPTAAVARCELTCIERQPIDLAAALAQHREYEEALEGLGLVVHRLPPEPELPDAVFVEDAAVVLDELALQARPGAPSRRAEVPSVAAALGRWRALAPIDSPGTLDGGDVLRLGRTLYVGASRRTNRAGVEQMAAHLRPFGYRVVPVPFHGCLHLKSAVTQVAEDLLLVNPRMVDPADFDGARTIAVDPSEPLAANALLVGGTVVYPRAFPRTRARLEEGGIAVVPVDASELAKAEGGVTCCSLILRAGPAGG